MQIIVKFITENRTSRHGIALSDNSCSMPRKEIEEIIKEGLKQIAEQICDDELPPLSVQSIEFLDEKDILGGK